MHDFRYKNFLYLLVASCSERYAHTDAHSILYLKLEWEAWSSAQVGYAAIVVTTLSIGQVSLSFNYVSASVKSNL